jgi:hypothetical protein
MRRTRDVVLAALALLWTAVPVTAHATPQMLSQAKGAGMPVKNCQYCHVAAVPKKDTFKPEDLNERGRWLLGEKDKMKAKDVNAEWLKNYPGGK